MTQLSYEHAPIHESSDPLIDLGNYPFILEPAYYNQGIAFSAHMQIRRGVAEKLATIQADLNSGYRFKIWDGYRSRAIQDAIYHTHRQQIKAKHPTWDDEQLDYETEQFVTRASSVERIPPHATGGAIDLTLADAEGNELDMGTIFDHFGPKAEPYYFQNDQEYNFVHENRMMLRKVMLDAGFTPDKDEWWHFDYGNQVWAVNANQREAIYGEVI